MEALLNLEFTAYVALAFILYAIRRASRISNRYIPLIGIFLGLGFAVLEAKAFNFEIMLSGLKYALYGVGTVAGIKYVQNGNGGHDQALLSLLPKKNKKEGANTEDNDNESQKASTNSDTNDENSNGGGSIHQP
ncbi:phage holin family protein [Salirhabdus salicampi]|uniref:phage holin family protein n=1 Tax=Salirhabdus salicampi TaxID=476102 RepID=UPI0020C3A0D8|nr:phage holin family protein [Salirhabdus salicampi]MCP8617180.1 phage holin family protein [Salirhabdus salicampi]